jgi:hypothetical protein
MFLLEGSLAHGYFRGDVIGLVAARRAGRAHGPAASALWRLLIASPYLDISDNPHYLHARGHGDDNGTDCFKIRH